MCFLNRLFLRAVVGSQQNWEESRDFSGVSYPHICTATLTANLWCQRSAFVTSQLPEVHSLRVWTHVTTCVHCPDTACALPSHLLPAPGNRRSCFSVSAVLSSPEWHRVGIPHRAALQFDFFHSVICAPSSTSSRGSIAHFFLVLNNIPLSRDHSVSVHLLKDILVAAKFRQFQVKLL